MAGSSYIYQDFALAKNSNKTKDEIIFKSLPFLFVNIPCEVKVTAVQCMYIKCSYIMLEIQVLGN